MSEQMQPQQTSLAQRVTAVATDAVNDEAIRAGLEHAKYALSCVVTDPASLEQASQIALNLVTAKKALAAKKKPITSALTAARDAVVAVFGPVEAQIAEAEKYNDNQINGYQAKLRREAEAERVRLENERIAAEREARRLEDERKKLEAQGVVVPPPPPAPPPIQTYAPPAETKVRTEAGTVSTRWTLEFEMVNAREVPEDWLLLDGKQARAWGQTHAEAEGLVKKDGASIVHRGVRYWYEPDVHKSGR